MPFYVNIELTGSFAGGSGSILVGLGTHSGVKSKCLVSAHLRGASYKKPKKPAAVGSVVNTSAGPISLEDLGKAGAKPAVSWGSDVSNIASSVSGLLDAENMINLVVKEMSYAEFGKNNGIDENMPRKTRIQTYMLDNPPKQLLFNRISDDDDVLKLPLLIVDGANQVPHIRLHALEKRNFKPVKSFTLDIEVSADKC